MKRNKVRPLFYFVYILYLVLSVSVTSSTQNMCYSSNQFYRKVYAVEKNFERFKTLQDTLSQSGATNVTTINKDVSQVGPEMCPGVEYIILDPSCSGSGKFG